MFELTVGSLAAIAIGWFTMFKITKGPIGWVVVERPKGYPITSILGLLLMAIGFIAFVADLIWRIYV